MNNAKPKKKEDIENIKKDDKITSLLLRIKEELVKIRENLQKQMVE